MKGRYNIEGMTCDGCKASVIEQLSSVGGVNEVDVNLEEGVALIGSDGVLNTSDLQAALSDKYTITAKSDQHQVIGLATSNSSSDKTKLQQLRPLLMILAYITTGSILIHHDDWNSHEFMLDFMGLFFIVFSFFKMLDLKGFAESFKMYDPLAARIPVYGIIYPFLETALGIMFLMRIEIFLALVFTIIILGLSTIGVTTSLLNNRSIRCACLGTVLDLPMTEATFIENAIMLIMATYMIFGMM